MRSRCVDTETSDCRWQGMDQWSAEQLALRQLDAHQHSLQCIDGLHLSLASAGEEIAGRLASGKGRLIYGGAGSAGAQACLDGLELPATFAWPKERLALLLAGGLDSFYDQGGLFEDNRELARENLNALQLHGQDVLIAVSASGNTPYTLELIELARFKGALTIAIVNNDDTAMQLAADHCLVLNTGAEAVAGSTRLAAATAQKIVLNTLSTLVMTRLGHLYDNLMVRMCVSNKKLQSRAVQIICQITDCDVGRAQHLLLSANLEVPIAVLMARGLSLSEARKKLQHHGGQLRAALEDENTRSEPGVA